MRLGSVLVTTCLALVACRPPGYGKGDDDGDIDAAVTGDGAPIDGAVDSPAATCTRSFRLEGYGGASSAWLTGTFTTWATTPAAGAVELALGADGAWTGERVFDAGSYQYKFIIDGNNWILDPSNADTVDDGMGHQNSRYVCAP